VADSPTFKAAKYLPLAPFADETAEDLGTDNLIDLR
jgi:hypothetical protein